MRALLIILPILAFLLLLLLAKLRFSLSYGESLSLSVRYLFLRFSLYPRRRKSKPTKKKKKKKAKKELSSQGSAKKQKADTKKKRKLSFGDIRFLLRVLRETLAKILDRASRHVRITVKELHITIGGERDAAVAAIEYGLVSQAASYLLAYLDHTGFLTPPREGAIDLRVDFTDREHALSARIDITCPILFLVPLLFSALTQALAAKGRWSRHRAASQKKNTPSSKSKETEHG